MPPSTNDLYISPKVGIMVSAVLLRVGAGLGSLVMWYFSKPSTTASVACSAGELDAKYKEGFAAAKRLFVGACLFPFDHNADLGRRCARLPGKA